MLSITVVQSVRVLHAPEFLNVLATKLVKIVYKIIKADLCNETDIRDL